MSHFLRRLVASMRRRRLNAVLQEELSQHIEWKTDSLIADGVPEPEARRRAAIAVGSLTRIREDARAEWGFAVVDSVIQDAEYGLRLLLRSPAFTIVAVMSLAIGIGASTAVFSLADAVLVQTMAVRDPASLVVVKWRSGPVFPFSSLNGYGEQTDEGLASTSFSYAAYDRFRYDPEARRTLDVAGYADLYRVNIVVDGRAEVGNAHAVSGNYFDMLGVRPMPGRAFDIADDRQDAPPVAVIGDRLWRIRFGSNPDIIGRFLTVNAVQFTVVGVAPRSFHGTGQVGTDPDLYVPLAMHARVAPHDDPRMDPNFWWVLVMGRLRPGVSAAEARERLDVILKDTVAAAKPALTAKDLPRVSLLPGGRGQVESRAEMRQPLGTMAIVAAIVLVVACANVATLLLVRGRARARELSVRIAIGAARARVVRQLFTEAILIAALGTALGILIARWMSAALVPALSSEPMTMVAGVNHRVLAFAALLAGASAAVFGLLPAFRATNVRLAAGLQEASRQSSAGPRHRTLSSGLVVVQIALSLSLVASAALLVRSVSNLESAELGFDASNILLFRIDPTLNAYDAARTMQLYDAVLARLRTTPGVVAASLTSHTLISHSASTGVARRPDESAPAPGSAESRSFSKQHVAWQLIVDDQFFATTGIRLLRGRTFVAADERGGAVAVVNRGLAKQLFGTEDAVGRRFLIGLQLGSKPYEVIGVSADARYSSIRGNMPPTAYFYYRQRPELKSAPTIEVRTTSWPLSLAPTVREIVRTIDPNVPVTDVRTQSDQIQASLRQERLLARLATLLGLVALLLSVIGLYGVLSYGVVLRTPEIGIRMALGARRPAVRWMVLRESLVLVAAGIAVGVPIALAGTRLLEALLFGLAPRDPLTLAGSIGVMLVLGALAAYLPARRASRVDPLVALRAE